MGECIHSEHFKRPLRHRGRLRGNWRTNLDGVHNRAFAGSTNRYTKTTTATATTVKVYRELEVVELTRTTLGTRVECAKFVGGGAVLRGFGGMCDNETLAGLLRTTRRQ